MQDQKNSMMPRKACAVEVYKYLGMIKTLGLVYIAAVFIVAVVSVFSKWGGAVSAGILSAAAMYYVWTANQKMAYLQSAYHIKPEQNKPLG